MHLANFFGTNPRAALGFSGGVDSAYLLYAGLKQGAEIQPYYVRSAFQPEFEHKDALRLCKDLGVSLVTIELDILAIPEVASNPARRCYFCKKAIFTALKQRALQDGYTLLIDGSNASDDAEDRPGMQALAELQVRSPLREAGLTKAEIRQLSKEAGLFTWNKPAYACLATRIPTETPIQANDLQRVEAAEDLLRQMGFSDLRVRLFHGAARLQLPKDQMQTALENAAALRNALAPYFETVLLDLAGR